MGPGPQDTLGDGGFGGAPYEDSAGLPPRFDPGQPRDASPPPPVQFSPVANQEQFGAPPRGMELPRDSGPPPMNEANPFDQPMGQGPPEADDVDDWPAQETLKGVPEAVIVELTKAPEELTAAVLKDAQPQINCFGEWLTRCLYAKAWNLRDAAIQKLALDADALASQHDPRELVAAFALVLKRAAGTEKIAQVFLTSQNLLHVLAPGFFSSSSIRRADLQPAIDNPLMPALVDKLGDANARCRDAVRDSLTALSRCPNVGPQFVAAFLLRPFKKNVKAPPRALVGRLSLLNDFVNSVGLMPANPNGMELEKVVPVAMNWFTTYGSAAEVRTAAVTLVGSCFARSDARRIEPFLSELRDAQKAVFREEFARVAGSQAPARQAQPAQQQRAAPPPEPEEDADEEFVCQFCGLRDESFTSEGLDLHYWKDCSMLTQCAQCQQVIEIMTLTEHQCEECERRDHFRFDTRSNLAVYVGPDNPEPPALPETFAATRCPLCRTAIDGGETGWRKHVLQQGCPKNPRRAA